VLTPEQGFRIQGALAGDYTGSSVSSAGDVNGDGFDDLLVGASTAHVGGQVNGSAFVVFGGNFTGAVSQLGTDGDDPLNGTSAADDIIGGQGNDVISGGGGRDVLKGGAGDDDFHVTDAKFLRIDGGGGMDSLHFDFAGSIDLGNLDGNAATSDRGKISGVDVIDVSNSLANTLTMHLADILDMDVLNQNFGNIGKYDNVLEIDGDAGDTLQLSKADGWSTGDKISVVGFTIYTSHDVSIAIDTDIQVKFS